MRRKVAVIGCGNWGATIANLIGENLDENVFDSTVLLFTHETLVDYEGQSRKLSELINHERVNPKYLPDIKINERIKAITEYNELTNVSVIVVCLPHKYLDTLKFIDFEENKINREELRVINLAKGLVASNGCKPMTPSEHIGQLLGCEVSTLQGANIAHEIAKGCYAETVIGYHTKYDKEIYSKLFVKKHFIVSFVPYNSAIEIFGALKNVVSLAMGVVDGMCQESNLKIKVSSNTKALIFRRGLIEIMNIAKLLGYTDVDTLIFESCGIADLFVSCMSGRNYKCGKMAVKYKGSNMLDDLESEFNGMKIEGLGTTEAIYSYLKSINKENEYLLIKMVYDIFYVAKDITPVYEYL